MNEVIIGIIGVLALVVVFASGFEIGFGLGVLGFLGFSYLVSMKAAFSVVSHDVMDIFTSYGFTVLPVFVLMGQVSFNAGIAKRLYNAANTFMGHVPGGLAMATVGACTAFGSIVGSTSATAATFSAVAIPEMDRYNYSKTLSAGIVASAGVLGCLIPPSVPLIIYGMITEVSIGKLFLASIIPGLLVSLFFLISIYGWVRINPSLAPKGEKFSWKERFTSLKQVIFVAIIFVVVMGGIIKGFFTPTEAGSVGCFSVALMAFLKRDLTLKGFALSLTESLVASAMVIMLITGSTIFGHFLTITKIPLYAGDWVVGLTLNRYVILAMIGLIYLLGGSVIDDLAFMILATPILYPVVTKLGFDLIWFGIFLQIVVMIGSIIPPIAVNVFIVNKISKVPVWSIYRGVYPFIIGMAIVCFLLALFPQLALFIPSLVKL
jgi:tripartite ATP-independent transporter DctM subunit